MSHAWWRRGGCLGGGAMLAFGLAAGPPVAHPTVDSSGSGSCIDCHAMAVELTHPVDVVPTMAVPDGLPLHAGRLTCTTCHDVQRSGSVAFLRGDAGLGAIGWCGQCHDPGTARVADVHALAMPRAHYGASSHRFASIGATPAGPDAESTTCLACHDDNLASGGRIRIGSGRPFGGSMLGGNHPIGVLQAPRGIGDHIVQPHELDPAIRLYDGRVGCGSCHSPYAPHEDLLVMSNDRSRLCLNCHAF